MISENFCRGIEDPCNTKACNFKEGKCGVCSYGCFSEMIGDGKCDYLCNNKDCLFDMKDCGCAEGCSLVYVNGLWENLESNKGNNNCLVPSCYYNFHNYYDPMLFRKVILSQIIYSQMQNTTFIDPYFECDNLSDYDTINSKICKNDDECFNENNLWCMGRSELIQDNCIRYGRDKCAIKTGVFILDNNIDGFETCPDHFLELKEI